jgi:predicted DNA-binding transcriptional regulator YafY
MTKNYSNESIRRFELLARILNKERITKTQAAEDYSVEEITISRDLQFFRSLGIEAFSRKNGIEIFNKVKNEHLICFASEYFALKMNSDYFLKSVKVFTKVDPNFYPHIVLLTKAIKESRIIKVTYQRLSDDEIKSYTLQPLRLVESNNNWILHAIKKDEIILQLFYLSRIISFQVTNKKFEIPTEVDENKEKYEIVLRFSPEVENEIYYKIWFDEFEITKDREGFIILKTEQPVTNRLASWCVSWWDKIKVLEPMELKNYISQMISFFKVKAHENIEL